MAKSPELIETVVAMTGETKASVSVTLSRLRQAELVPVTGRGPYAVEMDAEAAMRLLIAVCASVPLERNSAVKAVQRFEHLRSRPPNFFPEGARQNAKSIIMPLNELGDDHTVGDALKHLIEVSGRNELFTFLDAETGKRRNAFNNPDIRGSLRVRFMLPIPQVWIEHQFSGWLRKEWFYGDEFIAFDSYNTACRQAGLGDRARLTTLSQATIEEIGITLSR